MQKLCVFLVLAIAFNQALGMSVRQKRQSEDEEDLDDRYGWDFRPVGPNWGQQQNNRPGQGQGQFPGQGQGQFPGQGQGQFPGQGQGQFPGQGQGQLPGQGQGQLPGQGQGQLPGQGQGQLPGQGQQSTTTQAPTASAQDAIRRCIQNCPVTSEYNPVCGTNNVTYSNPGRLICARDCGTNVAQARTSPCPATPSG